MSRYTQKLQSIFRTLNVDTKDQQKISNFLDRVSEDELLYPMSISAKTQVPIQSVIDIFTLLCIEKVFEVYTVPKIQDQYLGNQAARGYKLPLDLEIVDELDFSVIPREDIQAVAAFKLVTDEPG